MTGPFRIVNGRVLLPGAAPVATDLVIEAGQIAAIGEDRRQLPLLDARGALVLPGMIDLHGDAFERQMLPRPGVNFPADLALIETDRQMLSNGITTAFHGITYSWEPGLRGRASALSLIEQIEALRGQLLCDTRIHLRWETFNLDGEADVADWLRSRRIDLLAFNDHIQDIRDDLCSDKRHKLGVYTHRTGLDAEAFHALFERVASRHAQVPSAVARLAGLAAQLGIPCASHDDNSADTRRWYQQQGVQLSEFPVSREVAAFSRSLGNPIILGAPNVVRGGSHCNRLGASDAIAQQLCDVLTSDYFYPSMLYAMLLLTRHYGQGIEMFWPLVSSGPASAVGWHDRGSIVQGKRADLILVDDQSAVAQVNATLVAGRLVYSNRWPTTH